MKRTMQITVWGLVAIVGLSAANMTQAYPPFQTYPYYTIETTKGPHMALEPTQKKRVSKSEKNDRVIHQSKAKKALGWRSRCGKGSRYY